LIDKAVVYLAVLFEAVYDGALEDCGVNVAAANFYAVGDVGVCVVRILHYAVYDDAVDFYGVSNS